MTDDSQTHCPEPSCTSPLQGLGSGWVQLGDLWWCPLHFYGEFRRLKRQQDEIAWYDGAIRKGEQWLKEETAERDRELATAKRSKQDRKHPDYPEYERRSAQRITRSEQRIATYTSQLADARNKRLTALAEHELENDNRRGTLRFNEESSEN